MVKKKKKKRRISTEIPRFLVIGLVSSFQILYEHSSNTVLVAFNLHYNQYCCQNYGVRLIKRYEFNYEKSKNFYGCCRFQSHPCILIAFILFVIFSLIAKESVKNYGFSLLITKTIHAQSVISFFYSS